MRGCGGLSVMRERFDTVIWGGTVVSSQGTHPAAIAIGDGRIRTLLPADDRPPAAEWVDARGLHVLPGIIDTHVHLRHPGHPGREDAESGTRAAAAGGITTLLEMPISKMPVNSADAVASRAEAIAAGALVDFALYGGAGQENVAAVAGQAEAGVVAFKTFLQPPPPARLDEFSGLWCTDDTRLRELMAAVAATGRRHAFHCEHAPLFAALQRRLESQGRRDGLAHVESRPPVVEEVSVAMVLALAGEARARVHIVHVSSPRSVQLVADARARGLDVTAETCPPYLFFTSEALGRLGGFAKCNPPLRSAEDVEGLWRYLVLGGIDVIGTDHSPFLDDEKARGAENIFLAPPGLCGLETALPLMLTAVHDGKLALRQLVTLMSERAASLFGLPGKGRLEPGADADLALVDLKHAWVFDHGRAVTRSRGNMRIYDGLPLVGRVVSTYVRGTRVFHEGDVVGSPGHGRFVRPEERHASSSH